MKELVTQEYLNNLFEILENGNFYELFVDKLRQKEFNSWKEQLEIKRKECLKWVEDNKILEQIDKIEKEMSNIFSQSYEIVYKLKEKELDLKHSFFKNKKLLKELDKQQQDLVVKSEQLKSDIVRIFSEVENNCGVTLADIMDKDYTFEIFRNISPKDKWTNSFPMYYFKTKLYGFTYYTKFAAEWDRLKCQILKCSAISEVDGLISTYITDKYTLLNERI